MADSLASFATKFEALAQSSGLDYFPVEFELVPPSFMMEVAVYGLPVRMPHWSFGVRYIYQLIQHRMGHSRLFEVVFPGNPGRAYLANSNSLEENTLVTAHVLGHADFSKNNMLFRRSQDQVGYRIVEQAAAHARRISAAIEEHGQQHVEGVLDAALALEQHIDTNHDVSRPLYPEYLPEKDPARAVDDTFRARFDALPSGEEDELEPLKQRKRAPIPPHRENDLLWFIAHYGPEIEDWESDIFLAVREESFYFYPVFACQIMNEGWASYWHARLLREADFLPNNMYLDALKAHSDVVRPYAGDQQIALAVNPYHLGFFMWEKIIEEQGLEAARKIMMENADFGFIRNYLTECMAEELQLFQYNARKNGEIKVTEADLDDIHEAILAPKYNFGAPTVGVEAVQTDGTLELVHDHNTDGRGLDLDRARQVLGYVHRVWRRHVSLRTIDEKGDGLILHAGDGKA